MKPEEVISSLEKTLPKTLAQDLVKHFTEIRNDCKTGLLEKASGGKFIETCVQVLQFLETGKYEMKPVVDHYLKNLESASSKLPDDLKICAARIARSCYTLRNKRNILHKGQVDPNVYDLRYVFAGAQWILSEIVRHVLQTEKALAGKLVEFIQVPVSAVVEVWGDSKIVHGDLRIREELLVLLHSEYPAELTEAKILQCLERRSKSRVREALSDLWKCKTVGRINGGYKLTQQGYAESMDILGTID
jgi:hypothetical protein